MPDGTYAPQSPDLSSFLSSPQKKSAPTSSYTPKSPSLPNFSSSTSTSPTSTSTASYHSPQHLNATRQSFTQQQHFPTHPGFGEYSEYAINPQSQSYLPPIPDIPQSHAFPAPPPPPQPQQQQQFQASFPPQQPYQPPQGQFRSQPAPNIPGGLQSQYQLGPNPSARSEMSSTRTKRSAALTGENGAGSAQDDSLGPSLGIEIKTKFPVARIKRIMQADEEVGKVAQVTPVAVSKALELFMISLVTQSSAIAKSANSKRVTAQHLKRAVEANAQYDFLVETVAKVAEGPDAGGKRVKSEDASDDEDGEKAGGGRAKKARGGRRKKGDV